MRLTDPEKVANYYIEFHDINLNNILTCFTAKLFFISIYGTIENPQAQEWLKGITEQIGPQLNGQAKAQVRGFILCVVFVPFSVRMVIIGPP